MCKKTFIILSQNKQTKSFRFRSFILPILHYIIFIRQLVQSHPQTSQERVHRLKWQINIRNPLTILLPDILILLPAFSVISISAVGQKSKQVDCVEISSNLGSTGQTLGQCHDEISCIIHMSSNSPET